MLREIKPVVFLILKEETYVISEIIKSYYNKGVLEPPIYFYRDKNMTDKNTP